MSASAHPSTSWDDNANSTTKEEEEKEMMDIEGASSHVNKDGQFKVDTDQITRARLDDQELEGLGLSVFNQDDFEQGVLNQMVKAMKDDTDREKRDLNKKLDSIKEDIKNVEKDLDHIRKAEDTEHLEQNVTPKEKQRRLDAMKKQKANKLSQLKTLLTRQRVTMTKIQRAEEADMQPVSDHSDDAEPPDSENQTNSSVGGLNGLLGKESRRERMIRMGLMTPFGTVVKKVEQTKESEPSTDFEQFLTSRETKDPKKKRRSPSRPTLTGSTRTLSETNLAARKNKSNRFDEKDVKNYDPEVDYTQRHFQRKRQYEIEHSFSGDPALSGDSCPEDGEIVDSDQDYVPDGNDMRHLSEPDTEDEQIVRGAPSTKKRKLSVRKTNVAYRQSDDEDYPPVKLRHGPAKVKRDRSSAQERDDADESFYLKRLRLQQQREQENNVDYGDDEEFDGGLVVPGKIWHKLFKYQQTCVRWLWELHCQEAGGIVGDEMGLGKTIQTIAFLAALKTSRLRSKEFPKYLGLGPVVIVCPATVMHQWVKEFHTWWPDFRVVILHSSGSYTGTEAELVRSVVRSKGVLVTSYNTLVIQQESLLAYDWHYLVLDEGHKIRNPDAQATLCCKQFRTCHRIILSGSPIQNNLKELWSLFDFVFPGKLGTLPDFMAHFSVPIVQGGYANATQVQVETSYKCACVLRDTINPYLLRRMKADVKTALDLPGKSEQVLFCRMSDEQRDVYQEYLDSRECQAILAGKYQIFAGLTTLRKICNHPDLCTGGPRVLVGQDTGGDPELEYGFWRRSGKLVVVEALFKLWHQQGHRVLLFSQSKAMLDIIEGFVQDRQYSYLRMDGGTPISARQPLIAHYNKTPSIYVFLLTTRVGGLGVNLTGANRIIIFDPDWNPSTDMQARERAWRIGQKRQVTVYRLLTSGTIEEKIYHRQIFKQFLTNRVLKDPKQRRFFKSNDILELFTLGSKDDATTETSAIFAGTGSNVHMPRSSAEAPKPTPKALKPNRFDQLRKEREERKKAEDAEKEEEAAKEEKVEKEESREEEDSEKSTLSMQERMREMARKLSRQMEEAKRQREKGSSGGGEKGNRSCDMKDGSKSKTGSEQSRDRRSYDKHREHRKKKRRKDAKCEGQRIPNLVKSCDYKPQQGGDRGPDSAMDSKEQDDYVLRKLFKKTGIQGVMKHDKIMESGRADYAIVEAEATRVAKDAVAALRHSRSLCHSAASGVPTWTGSHGATAAKPRFGQKKNTLLVKKPTETSKSPEVKAEGSQKKSRVEKEAMFDGSQAGSVSLQGKEELFSSADLLVRIHKRQLLSSEGPSEDGTRANSASAEDTELLQDIRSFVAFMGNVNGQASTQELLTNFGPRLPPGDSAKFKAMLLQICDFSKMNGSGTWVLKQEFR